ncbi:MAG TPA: V-type ATPase subunit [Spirochaetota bacterium]|nr:V-type ATPase subunit [Spirochaetota bacterium]HOM37609.1 V-type ATPase subunit [Spirochaetota bacterium]HPQ49420.1 V-type ATPase subunit [Spirochaetota bacterium]
MYYNVKFSQTNDYIFEASLVNMRMYNLIGSEDYNRLLESDNIDNILSSLSDRGYNVSSRNIDFITEESKLLNDVIKFSKNKIFTEYYRIQYDILNLKTIYKALLKNEPFENLAFYNGGILKNDDLKMIYSDEYKRVLHPDIEAGIKFFEKNIVDNTPFDVDVTWDKYLNLFFIKKARELNNDFIIKFHNIKADINNILSLFRLKSFNKDYKVFQKTLMPSANDYSYILLKLYKEDLDIIVAKLSFLDIAPYIKKGYEEYRRRGSLTFLENSLYDFLYNEYLGFASNRIFGPEIIFSYFWRKKREIEKVRLLLSAKINNVSKLFLEKLRD